MKVGLYAGSFNPWHEGHEDVLKKALQIFDKVVVCQMFNPDKNRPKYTPNLIEYGDSVDVCMSHGTLRDLCDFRNFSGIIRGLRDGKDLDYEKSQQYWNEDVGIEVPFVYFISDRSLVHVSSSSIRIVEELGLGRYY